MATETSIDTIEQVKQVAGWLRLFADPAGVIELRAPKVKRKFGRPVTVTGFYDAEHVENGLARDALDLSRRGLDDVPPPGVYFTLNPVNPDLLARRANRCEVAETGSMASDADIVCRRWLLVDVDPVRPAEISSSDPEKEAAKEVLKRIREALTASGWPAPIIGDSGNGYHAYYRIDLPTEDGGLVKSVLNALAERYDTDAAKVDTTVFNPSRICKIPGTTSRKGDPIESRPHRVSRLLVVPDQIETVPVELLAALANEWREKEAQRKAAAVPQPEPKASPGTRKGPLSILDRAARYMRTVDGAVSGQHGSDQTIKAAGFLVRGFNLPVDDAFPIFAEWNLKCDPPWDEHELRRKLEEANKHDGERGWLLNERPSTRQRERPAVVSGENLEDESLLDPEQQTDAALASRFVKMYGGELKYVSEWKRWIRWSGKRWEASETGQEIEYAKRFSEWVWRQKDKIGPNFWWDGDKKIENPLLNLAKKVSAKKFLFDVGTIARSTPGMCLAAADLDRSPWLFNVENGVLDLRTAELSPHEPGQFITKLCPLKFDPDALCPRWEEFLYAVMGQDVDLSCFLQRWFGYCITGDVSEHKLPILWGTGGNGKSVLVNTILKVIGEDYSHVANDDLLIQKNQHEHPTILASLAGRRLVLCSETGEGARFNEPLLKKLTGGDPVTARRLYENEWTFQPSHKLMILTNHKPIVRGMDAGIWRRLLLIPFTVLFWDPADSSGPPELMQDKDLPEKLLAEAAGILVWLVRGAAAWHANGLDVPEAAKAATGEYRTAQDVYQGFLNECCLVGNQTFKVKAKHFYAAYIAWCQDNGEEPRSSTAFGRVMADRFAKYTNNGVWYSGVALVDNFTEEPSAAETQRDLWNPN